MLHHDRKAEGDLIDRVSGTLGIAGAADHIIGLIRGETPKFNSNLSRGSTVDGLGGYDRTGGTQREQRGCWQLEVRGRDLLPATFNVAMDGPRWKCVDLPDDPDKATAIRMRRDGKTLGEISEALGRPKSTIQDWVRGK